MQFSNMLMKFHSVEYIFILYLATFILLASPYVFCPMFLVFSDNSNVTCLNQNQEWIWTLNATPKLSLCLLIHKLYGFWLVNTSEALAQRSILIDTPQKAIVRINKTNVQNGTVLAVQKWYVHLHSMNDISFHFHFLHLAKLFINFQ